MRVQVLYFGILREAAAAAEQWVELPGDAGTVADLLQLLAAQAKPGVQALWPRLAVAVNRRYAHRADPLHADDEVALLPPVSGGAPGEEAAPGETAAGGTNVLLTHAPLSAEAAVAALKAASDGAVVVFDGIVRNHTRGRETKYLVYESYEAMALETMRELVRAACRRFAVREALLHHRLGKLMIGETSVLIAVASAHRGAAFDACRWIIDTLKQTVPIWKKEYFVDGAVWADGEPFPEDVRPGEPV